LRNQPESFIGRYEEKILLGRMAKESDFIGVLAFLASDSSAYMTGQNLLMDGGWS
jgi:NAD(P)-dependent dehydrogenase (short-subunit alcohol dehydrogenase family)